MNVRNTTRRPLRVPLPGGKKLHLGPGKTGQISSKAATFAPLKALIESGELETSEEEGSIRSSGTGRTKGPGGTQGRTPDGGVRHTGDR